MMSAGLAPWKLLNTGFSELHWLLTGTPRFLQCGQLPTEQVSKRDWAPRWKSQSFHNWILVWYRCPITFAVSHSLGRDRKSIQQQRKRAHTAANQGGRSLWATLATACYYRANGTDVTFHSWIIRVSLPLRQRAAKRHQLSPAPFWRDSTVSKQIRHEDQQANGGLSLSWGHNCLYDKF